MVLLRGIDTLSRETTLSKLFLSPSGTECNLQGKNLLTVGAQSL